MELETPVTDEIKLVFGTPVLMIDVPDAAPLNQALSARIAAERSSSPGVRASNIGGWQSTHFLWTWDYPGAETLRGAMQRAVLTIAGLAADETDLGKVEASYRIQGWANVNREGDYNVRHCHAQFDWTMAYFVACGTLAPDRPLAGKLEIYDPRQLAEVSSLRGFAFAGSMLIDPVPGKLVLFPAWLEHYVHPWHGTGEQVVVYAVVKMTGGRHSGLRAAGA